MKKFLIIVLAVLLLTGCEKNKENEKENYLQLKAINCAITYLNNTYGYDTNKSYELECYVKTKEDTLPRLFKLIEDEKEIAEFTIMEFDNENQAMQHGSWWTEHEGLLYVEQWNTGGFTSKDFEGFEIPLYDVSLNNSLYLENVKDITLSEFQKSGESEIEKVKCLADANLDLKEGDEITIYEHLNYILLEYNKENSIICDTPRDTWRYPVAVNGEIKWLVSINISKEAGNGGSGEFTSQEQITKIMNGNSFVIANNVLIDSSETIQIDTPVIVKKAYTKLKELAEKQGAYEIILRYRYGE